MAPPRAKRRLATIGGDQYQCQQYVWMRHRSSLFEHRGNERSRFFLDHKLGTTNIDTLCSVGVVFFVHFVTEPLRESS